jgi:hypothetical protein
MEQSRERRREGELLLGLISPTLLFHRQVTDVV